MSVNLTRNFDANYPVVLLNNNAMEMLSIKYPELSRYLSNIKEDGKYIFKPSNISNDSEALYNAKLNLKSIYNMTENEIPNAIPYNSHIEVVGIMNQARYQSENLINPIIIYDNDPPKFSDELATGISSFAVSIMYDIDNEEIQDFIKEFGLEDQIVNISNVQDVFEYNYTIAKRSMKFNLIIAAFLMILEISMISIIIRMEFRYNAIELALKKIYGYTVFERFSKLVTVTVGSLFSSGLIILIVSRFVNKSSLKYILFEILVLLFIELALIYLKAISLEHKNYVTILKGERI